MLERDNISHFFLPPELKFISAKKFKNGHIWYVKKLRQEFEVCPKCASPSTTRCGKAYSTVREEQIQNRPLWLRIQKHRYFCKTCRKPFTEPVAGIFPRRRTTQRFRRSVRDKCLNFVNLSRVRKDVNCSSGLVYQLHYEQAEIKLRELKGSPWPKRIGIDEHFFSRRNGFTEFATVFTNLKKGEAPPVLVPIIKRRTLCQSLEYFVLKFQAPEACNPNYCVV